MHLLNISVILTFSIMFQSLDPFSEGFLTADKIESFFIIGIFGVFLVLYLTVVRTLTLSL